MVATADEDGIAASIDAALSTWRQGDVVLDDVPFFLHLADLNRPLTVEARAQALAEPPGKDGLTGVASQPRGYAVASQTCEIVRACTSRPKVELAVLVERDASFVDEVRRLRRPRYAYVPGVAQFGFVADLDEVMVVEKAVLAPLARVRGCRDDREQRAFAEALARKRSRFAFPDDFNAAFDRVQRRFKDKHKRDSSEGALARAIREIRVRAAPDWDAPSVALTFLFVLSNDEPAPTSCDEAQIRDWLDRFDATGRFRLDTDLPWRLCFLEDLNAREYQDSDRLDLDDLSQR